MKKEEALAVIKNGINEWRSACNYKICEYCKECTVEKLDEAIKTIETLLREVD